MSTGATPNASSTSAPVGDTSPAPGISMRKLTVVTMLDAVSSSSGYCSSCSLANSSTKVTVSSSKMSSDCTNTPSSLDDDVSAWSRSRSSITCES